MKHLRKALYDILVQSLNTEQMNHLGREVDPEFNVYEFSGFGDKIVIPRKVAADCIIQYFNTEEKLLDYVAYMLIREGHGASGGVIQLKGTERLIQMLRERGWNLDRENQRFVRDQKTHQNLGWGFMKQEEEYQLSFVSLDVVSSSELVRTNVKGDVEATLSRLKAYVRKHVEFWDGRLWYWYGDGGLAAFQGEDSAPMSVLSMISILSYLPVFNIAENQLRPENDVKLRVGMHYGRAIYKDEVNKISSPDMRVAQEIEKAADPNSIRASEAIASKLPLEVRRNFQVEGQIEGFRIYRYAPL
ncbi:MAG: hypothetical protein H7A21_06600 [Spirochaetales bacterium]|nr:hypothetical protein [Leptospiraceae bacterium]MCB1326266.1 hypothetical protein [Leptospiraceae bacterium]MCP5481083.1 hypothetical protein [Spirochaetales bacterium]MCP5485463.1 hypothetical protein [Spirochaetales bacterium]